MDDPADHAQVLHVVTTDEGHGPPRISWMSADELRVTAPNRSYLSNRRHAYRGVRIDLHFDPDEPAAYAARLKRHNAAPPPSSDE